MNPINTLTIAQVAASIPAVRATGPAPNVSDKYQFVSTLEALELAEAAGFKIVGARAANLTPYAQHQITMVHKNQLDLYQKNGADMEGIARLEIFNSHDRTRRFMFAAGFFRLICSNGLIMTSGLSTCIRVKHKFADSRRSEIMANLEHADTMLENVISKIDTLKERILTYNEQKAYAQYALLSRFAYRPNMPKRFQDIPKSAENLLSVRRDQDEGDNLWTVFNRVQENTVRGVEGFSRGIRGFYDQTRMNFRLWEAAELSLRHSGNDFAEALLNKLENEKAASSK